MLPFQQFLKLYFKVNFELHSYAALSYNFVALFDINLRIQSQHLYFYPRKKIGKPRILLFLVILSDEQTDSGTFEYSYTDLNSTLIL